MASNNYTVYNCDMFDLLASMDSSSVDAVIVDPPYGVLKADWDRTLNPNEFIQELLRVVKDSGIVACFSKQPFASQLILAGGKYFRQELIWSKNRPTGFLKSRSLHLTAHENILIFSKTLHTRKKEPTIVYNPQGLIPIEKKGYKTTSKYIETYADDKAGDVTYDRKFTNFPTTILNFDSADGKIKKRHKHPTMKPLALMRYLVRTYSNEGATIFDPTCGSGTTGVAALLENRKFIGCDLSEEYADMTIERLNNLAEEV